MKLKMPFTKEYFEEFAKLLLNKLFNYNLIHRDERYDSDKPDLISFDEKRGIEVTNAWSEYEGRHNKLLQFEYDKDNLKEEVTKIAKIIHIENELHFDNDIPYLKDDIDGVEQINTLDNRIREKLDKLNKKRV